MVGFEDFVDWYNASDMAAALEMAKEESANAGVPESLVTRTVEECDPQTMEPIQ